MTEYQNIFNVHYYLTKENFVGENIKSGRIPVKDILEKITAIRRSFLFCGSMDFCAELSQFALSWRYS